VTPKKHQHEALWRGLLHCPHIQKLKALLVYVLIIITPWKRTWDLVVVKQIQVLWG